MEILGKLFGSETKVKIIRLFLFNPETVFETSTIAERVKEDILKVRREINGLNKILFVKQRAKRTKGGSRRGYILNENFSYLTSLQNLLVNSKPLQAKEILRKAGALGSIKLLIVAGIFIQNADSRVDILIVGDNIKKGPLTNLIKNLEAEIGKELRYAYFSSVDFTYRLSVYDKLVRDVLDYPHQTIVNKLALLEQE